jgi:Protein of unknown function (DUF3108)
MRHTRTSAACRVLLLLGAGLYVVPALGQRQLTPYSAEYDIKVSIAGGRLNTELKAIDGSYVATHVVQPTGIARLFAHGSISETSEFYTTDDGLRPDRYHSEDTLSRKAGTVAVRFDWQNGEARGTVDDTEIVSAMDGIAYDRVSIQYELMYDLLNETPSDEYVLFEVDRLRHVTIHNVGRRTVRVPAGTFNTVGIQHETEKSKRTTTLWCAEELGYLPVMIEQFRKGKLTGRAELARYTPEPAVQAVRREE